MALTTTEAPFIEQHKNDPSPFIEQPYHLYSAENQETWRRLYSRIQPRWRQYANRRFLEGLEALALPADRIPHLEEVNRFLATRTRFEARAVHGLVPGYVFFDCLRNRIFPTTITIRSSNSLDYLPEPDIFHDLAGHVPMHTDQKFAETLVRFGECACEAEQHPNKEAVLKAMGRFFWFTVEFGLMKSTDGLRAYGSGLLSSFGELQHSIDSPNVKRLPFDLDTVIHQEYDIDHYQPVLFYVDSFDHLYNLVEEIENAMRAGKLDGTN
jgi:phenylalanine-4-hydroxylase